MMSLHSHGHQAHLRYTGLGSANPFTESSSAVSHACMTKFTKGYVTVISTSHDTTPNWTPGAKKARQSCGRREASLCPQDKSDCRLWHKINPTITNMELKSESTMRRLAARSSLAWSCPCFPATYALRPITDATSWRHTWLGVR